MSVEDDVAELLEIDAMLVDQWCQHPRSKGREMELHTRIRVALDAMRDLISDVSIEGAYTIGVLSKWRATRERIRKSMERRAKA